MREISAAGRKPGNFGRVQVVLGTLLDSLESQKSSAFVGPALQTRPGTMNIPTLLSLILRLDFTQIMLNFAESLSNKKFFRQNI